MAKLRQNQDMFFFMDDVPQLLCLIELKIRYNGNGYTGFGVYTLRQFLDVLS